MLLDKEVIGPSGMTPRAIVAELDKHVIGQADAKRAVANAIRNRMRRLQVPHPMKEEILPKNILMIGSTGIGKTEIARRLAVLTDSPFVKVEATKFTEVGYVGKDVDSIIRDLVEDAFIKERDKAYETVNKQAKKNVLSRVIDALKLKEDFEKISKELSSDAQNIEEDLYNGLYDDVVIEIDVQGSLGFEVVVPHGMEEISNHIQQLMQTVQSERSVKRKMTVKKALEVLQEEESSKLLNEEDIKQSAVRMAEQQGIVFIDEIDKVVRSNQFHGDVSREGVQRDLLPLLDGSVVSTKFGNIKTDYILFIASGAFMNNQPSDMLSELQGRLPICVKLDSLHKEDFIRILLEPKNSLVKQYQSLMLTEGVDLNFNDDAIDRIAEISCYMNSNFENIGARRLQTVMEKLLDTLSFEAESYCGQSVVIDRHYVDKYIEEEYSGKNSDWIL